LSIGGKVETPPVLSSAVESDEDYVAVNWFLSIFEK
jgi:hypothetical protein